VRACFRCWWDLLKRIASTVVFANTRIFKRCQYLRRPFETNLTYSLRDIRVGNCAAHGRGRRWGHEGRRYGRRMQVEPGLPALNDPFGALQLKTGSHPCFFASARAAERPKKASVRAAAALGTAICSGGAPAQELSLQRCWMCRQ